MEPHLKNDLDREKIDEHNNCQIQGHHWEENCDLK